MYVSLFSKLYAKMASTLVIVKLIIKFWTVNQKTWALDIWWFKKKWYKIYKVNCAEKSLKIYIYHMIHINKFNIFVNILVCVYNILKINSCIYYKP